MSKKIFNIIVSIVFILLLFGCIRNTARSYRYRNLCNQYTEQFIRAENANRELTDRIGRVAEITGRIKETTDANITDARGIIEAVEKLRTEVQELENICYGYDTLDSYYDWLDSELGLQ